MKKVSIVLAPLLLALCTSAWSESVPGRIKGGEAYVLPAWFNTSFLDLHSDVQAARDRKRHVLVFFHLDECPYCSRMLDENFFSGDNRQLIQSHFDVIGMNVRGDLEVTWIDGQVYSERSLAKQLRTLATPTIVFLDLDGNKVLQLTGYRDPRALRYALDYVKSERYRSESFKEYLAQLDKPEVYSFLNHPQLSTVTYFKGYSKPLALLFEDKGCMECARFHEKTLNHPDVVEELKKFLFVRLDADSDRMVIDIEGRKTTPSQWVKGLDLTYRPALVLFNEGREISRADGRLYHFHLKEALNYVSGAYYRQFDTVSEYKAAYRAELLANGIDIDFGE